MNTCDVAIVGAGIAGLAHALAASRQGLKVTVFERDSAALGASIRNFGLGLALGQRPGDMRTLALRSREIWLDVLAQAGCWHKAQGSLIIARDAAEWAVLQEFQAVRGAEYHTQLVGVDDIAAQGLPATALGGLFSPSEIALEARVAIPAIARWLQNMHGITFVFGTQVNAITLPHIHTSSGVWQAGRAIVCAGHDFQTLYPEAFAGQGLKRCSLQMLRTRSPGFTLGPALMTGLSTLRYEAFDDLASLAALRAQVREHDPFLLDEGIHLIVQQVGHAGELLIGDSHRYGESVGPFNTEAVDARLLQLAEAALGRRLEVAERWQGIYASGPGDYLVRDVAPGVMAVAITAGVGMSISFALAERNLAR
ncbi:tRNA 5-methylaminomethyl-2-thiouridine biosynthesis bifunctional protein MnmC [Andreprevotia sp. IGB-42]|uniref:TIGR03364 family FAD-dependent oxidoreductase n=1 Tax=Andreprevotia sp. IGB-42 TaxID=2497473 RepID=UPI0013580750|nr:TIGR03364 family FAD-dependent oxidoreductase [Andreprevotia sp. IGB-42]KAF0814279.1 tRNA 5-methylaminomethyl-2-thiouridine biosynthesis bifunctional protein MnmC [Andreprevotia sp. IGB-42]